METTKKETLELIDSLGNEPKNRNSSSNIIEWMEQNNPLTNMEGQPEQKGKCKTGKCGKNGTSIAVVSVILFVVMLAGHGLFTLIEKLIK